MKEIKDKEKLYLDKLSEKFNKQDFCNFIGDLLNMLPLSAFNCKSRNSHHIPSKTTEKGCINKSKLL